MESERKNLAITISAIITVIGLVVLAILNIDWSKFDGFSSSSVDTTSTETPRVGGGSPPPTEEVSIEQLVERVVEFEITFHSTTSDETPEERLEKIRPFLHPQATLPNEVDLISGPPGSEKWTVTAIVRPGDVEDPWFYDQNTAYVITTVTKTITDATGQVVNTFQEKTERNWVNTPEGWFVYNNGETVPPEQIPTP